MYLINITYFVKKNIICLSAADLSATKVALLLYACSAKNMVNQCSTIPKSQHRPTERGRGRKGGSKGVGGFEVAGGGGGSAGGEIPAKMLINLT